MKSFVFSRPCGAISEHEFADLETAKTFVESLLGDIVWAEQPDADGTNDDGAQCYRLLCWESEEDAENDSGAESIGQLEWIED